MTVNHFHVQKLTYIHTFIHYYHVFMGNETTRELEQPHVNTAKTSLYKTPRDKIYVRTINKHITSTDP